MRPSAGEGDVIAIGLDLDSQNPIAQSIGDSGNFQGAYFNKNYVTLAEYEIATFRIIAKAQKYCYEWELVVDVLEDGKEATVIVRDGAQPFRTTGPSNSYNKYYEWAWYATPPNLITTSPDS